jgi:outer membrane receptor protein involved in Fe transport
MAYARAAAGYRPGGPNPVLPNVPASFAPDKVIDYEVGFKGILPDHTFSWDAALFQINWQHVQLGDTDAATQFAYTTNGGQARSRGVELALDWKPYRGLSIDATTTFLDATLTETLPTLVGADSLVGRAGDRLPVSARFSSNLSVQQDFPLAASLTGFVGANWSFVGTRESEFVSSAPGSSPRFQLPSYSLIDFRAGVNYRSSWHLNVFLRNLTNKEGVVRADNRNGTSVTTATFLQPRTVGFFVAKEF